MTNFDNLARLIIFHDLFVCKIDWIGTSLSGTGADKRRETSTRPFSDSALPIWLIGFRIRSQATQKDMRQHRRSSKG